MSNATIKTLQAFMAIGATAALTACFDSGSAPQASASSQDPMAESIMEAEKAGLAKPVREKTEKIFKTGEDVTERIPVMETNEGRYLFIDGEWKLDASTLAKKSIEGYATGVIKRIGLTAGNTSGASCPSQYSKLNVDLNRRAGGKWVFLCYSTIADDINTPANYGINAWSMWTTYQYTPMNTNQYNMYGIGGDSNGDMNQGAAGVFMYGKYGATLSDMCPIQGIGVITSPYMMPSPPSGWVTVAPGHDLNKEAGGDFIIMVVKKPSVCKG